MIVLLNGSFGVGKTTVARLLQRKLAGSTICDPENVGVVVRMLAPLLNPRRQISDDYQDIPQWRTWTLGCLRASRLVHRVLVVPMTFTNLAHLAEVRSGAARFDPDVRHFCLLAPYEVVLERLEKRAARAANRAWLRRRAQECCAIHPGPEFGRHVDTEGETPEEVAAEILRLLAPQAS